MDLPYYYYYDWPGALALHNIAMHGANNHQTLCYQVLLL